MKITPIQAVSPRLWPLNTPKDQYLLFRLFELLGVDHFEKLVLVGICHLDFGDTDFAPPTDAVDKRLKLARNITVGGEFETIEEFDRVAAPFLDCSDFNSSDEEVPEGLTLLHGRIDLAGRALGRTIAPILLSLLPEPAEAAVVGGCCLGGATSRLSPWGAVDSLSGQEVEFFRDDDAGETFNPGDHTFTTGFILSWMYTTEGSVQATAYPAVQVIDPTSGQPRSGVNVTVSLIQVDGSGTLSGTLTRTTSAAAPASEEEPAAVFNDLIINQEGTYKLKFTFTAPGLPDSPSVESGTFTVQDQIT